MSLSNIIKLQGKSTSSRDILTTSPRINEIHEEKFHSLESLWQSSDTEYIDAKARLEEEKVQARQKAQQMVADAKKQAASIEQAARDKGFQVGKEEALAQEKKKLQEKLTAFDQLLAALEKDRKVLYSNYENDIITLVKTMVDRVVFHEVSVNPQVIQACLKTAMSYVVENSNVTIHLHAKDLNRLKEANLERPDLLVGTNQIELTEDPAIAEGGCLIETSFGEVDATLELRKEKLYRAIDAIFVKANADPNLG